MKGDRVGGVEAERAIQSVEAEGENQRGLSRRGRLEAEGAESENQRASRRGRCGVVGAKGAVGQTPPGTEQPQYRVLLNRYVQVNF